MIGMGILKDEIKDDGMYEQNRRIAREGRRKPEGEDKMEGDIESMGTLCFGYIFSLRGRRPYS